MNDNDEPAPLGPPPLPPRRDPLPTNNAFLPPPAEVGGRSRSKAPVIISFFMGVALAVALGAVLLLGRSTQESDLVVGTDEPVTLSVPPTAAATTIPVPTSEQRLETTTSTTPSALGSGDGSVRVTLTWATDADLDLFVTEPNGTEARFNSCTGGSLDADQIPATGDNSTHTETVAWPDGAPSGTYQVIISNLSEQPTPYSLEIWVDEDLTHSETGTVQSSQTTDATNFTR